MKIVVLQGSPNIKGSTNILVEKFTQGAEEAGHSVQRFDVARMKIKSCLGCWACHAEEKCAQHDDEDAIRAAILDADMIAFASPLYYFNITSQLKTVIDRFCAFNTSLMNKKMKCAWLSVGADVSDWMFDAIDSQAKTMGRYLQFELVGAVYGKGCGTPEETAASVYPQKAYELGKSLKG